MLALGRVDSQLEIYMKAQRSSYRSKGKMEIFLAPVFNYGGD